MTFAPSDLNELDQLLHAAPAVVAMREIAAGNECRDVIGMRHDIDDNHGSFDTAVKLAQWEKDRGYRSTYYVLHTASYWCDGPYFQEGLETIALAGHEVGIHVNALAAALADGGDPDEILWDAVEQLRDFGHAVTGAASHGDEVCHRAGFVNYEQFEGCVTNGNDPHRTLTYRGRELQLVPLPLSAWGLTYEAYHLPKGGYLSDTGGAWNQPLEHDPTAGQLHVLQHPDWWARAFVDEVVAA